MRIDVDENLEKRLDQVKAKKWIGGKGHTETVRFLVDHYEQTGSIEQLIEKKLGDIEEKISNSILRALKEVINRLFSP